MSFSLSPASIAVKVIPVMGKQKPSAYKMLRSAKTRHRLASCLIENTIQFDLIHSLL